MSESPSHEKAHEHSSRAQAGEAPAVSAGSAAWLQWPERFAWLLAAGYGLLFFWVAWQRAAHPFALEWMENGSVEHLHRVLAGAPLFVLPSIEFVPFPYPPLYYWLSAPFTLLFDGELQALRAVSILSTLGVFALLAEFVRRESGSLSAGIAAAGLFAASYRASGGYFDVARIDALFTLLTLGTLFTLRFAKGAPGLVLAALLGTACIFTKQTGAVVLAPMVAFCAFEDWREHGWQLARWRRFAAFGLTLFVLSLAATVWLELRDGHFLLHILGAQQTHAIRWHVVLWFLRSDVFASLPVAVLLALALACFRPADRRLGFFAAALFGITFAVLIPRIKVSGALNNLVPLHAWLALLAGLALAWLPQWVGSALRPRFAAFLWIAIVAQFVGLAWDPSASLPPVTQRVAGERLVARIREIPGEVYLPAHSQLGRLAGKRAFAHPMPVGDFAKSGNPEAEMLRESFARALRERRFSAIVDTQDGFLERYPAPGILQHFYRRVGPALDDPRLLMPVEGYPVRTGIVWQRRGDTPK